VASALLAGAGALVAYTVGLSKGGKGITRLLLIGITGAPLLLTEASPMERAMLTIPCASLVLRGFSLSLSRASYSLKVRLITVMTPVDARYLKEMPRSWNLWLGLTIALNTLVATTAILIVIEHHAEWNPDHAMFYRWLCGLALFLSVPNLVNNVSVWITQALGYQMRPVHRQPYLATSLSDFWNRRWNLIVADFAARHVFLPVARRRGTTLGIWVVFAASALLHLWLGLMTSPWGLTLPFTFYFLFQAPFALLEKRLQIKSWPTWAARTWTYLIVIGPSLWVSEWLIHVLMAY